jgi:hypothetical protein
MHYALTFCMALRQLFLFCFKCIVSNVEFI